MSPADIIELGAEGPKFSFDVQPRPAHFMVRTRTLPKGVGATRAFMPSDTSASKTAPPPTSATAATPAEPVKRPIGHNTVIGMMAAQQSRTNRNWMYILAGVLLIIAAGGGGLYYHNKTEAEYAAAELDKQAEELRAQKATAAAEAAKQAAELDKHAEELRAQKATAAAQVAKQAAALEAQKVATEKGVQQVREDTQLAIKGAVGVARVKSYGITATRSSWSSCSGVVRQELGKQLYQEGHHREGQEGFPPISIWETTSSCAG